MKVFFLAVLSVFSSIYAEYEIQQYDIKKVSQTDSSSKEKQRNSISDKRVIIPAVKGVIIAPDGDKPGSYVLKTTKGVQIYRVMQGISIKKRDALQGELEKSVIGKPLTLEKIEEIKKRVSRFYQKNGHALVVVNVPEQDVTDGVIVVTVLEARLGKVTVTGNKYFSNEWYMNNLSIEEDQVIETSVIDGDVAYINNGPWRLASAIYKPGAKYGTTDIELAVRDERPARLFVGVDNTGFKVTNYNRIFVGFNWGSFLNYDQNLAFQYTAAPDFKKFQAYTVYYSAPLPWRDEIILFGGYSSVDVDRSDLLPTMHNHGSDWQASIRYGFFVPPSGNFFQKAKAGFDLKQTNNDLTVSNINYISSSYATVFQAVGAYEASYSYKRNSIDFIGEAFVQPWDFGKTMSETNYSKLRPNAVNKYLYVRLKAEYDWADPSGMLLSVKARAQLSSGALIPLETMGLGGINSIRGYVERVVNVDDGGILNLEFRTPYVSPSINRIPDRFSAIVFFDMGGGTILKNLQGQPKNYFLAGVGPGLRYDIGSVLRVKFDVGFRLTDEPFASSSPSVAQYYFGVIASY